MMKYEGKLNVCPDPEKQNKLQVCGLDHAFAVPDGKKLFVQCKKTEGPCPDGGGWHKHSSDNNVHNENCEKIEMITGLYDKTGGNATNTKTGGNATHTKTGGNATHTKTGGNATDTKMASKDPGGKVKGDEHAGEGEIKNIIMSNTCMLKSDYFALFSY